MEYLYIPGFVNFVLGAAVGAVITYAIMRQCLQEHWSNLRNEFELDVMRQKTAMLNGKPYVRNVSRSRTQAEIVWMMRYLKEEGLLK